MDQPNISNQDWYGLSTGLYDTISACPEVDSSRNHLEHFMEKLETEFISTIAHLHQKDTWIIPQCNQELAMSLHALAEDPDWSLVQLDKTSQWATIWIVDYNADMQVHLDHYWQRFPTKDLTRFTKTQTPLLTG
jgi:hypothetical protein